MKGDTEYTILIAFVAFLLVKKMVAFLVEVEFPTYEKLDKASTFWKVLVKIRSTLNFITIFVTSYFLYNYRFVAAARLIFTIILLRSVLYFLVDNQLVWLFINKTHKTRTIVHDLNTYGDSATHSIVAIIAIYALAKIFAPK